MFVSLLLATTVATFPQDPVLPVVEVTGPMVIRESCELQIAEDAIFADDERDGVIRINGDNLTVRFAPGSVLRGAPADEAQDQRTGIGIRADKADGLTLINVQVTGYHTGVVLSQCHEAQILGGNFWGNYAQRLQSNAMREVTADWLYPHQNNRREWEKQHGAAISVYNSKGIVIRNVMVREQQNGILLSQVSRSKIFDNDASFLSGWGLAMWRSSGNVISRNAFDYCIRGYSHGIYNRGQDSAGILMFEECSKNVIVENSATHGGDGLFGFAGDGALGKRGAPKDYDHRRKGNNDNLIVGNDFSFAAAHGLEMTFSFGNWIAENHFEGNAICGIWGGFSQEMYVWNNDFVANGDAGYGLEHGGINVDHPRNLWVLDNRFSKDHCGIHLWRFPGAFADLPWGKANNLQSEHVFLGWNTLETEGMAILARGELEVYLHENSLHGPGAQVVKEAPSATLPLESTALMVVEANEYRQSGPKMVAQARAQALGSANPIGARRHLGGRESILMQEWGPWDHEGPSLFFHGIREDGAHGYQLMPTSARVEEMAVTGEVDFRPEFSPDGPATFWIISDDLGVVEYALEVRADGIPLIAEGRFVTADWRVMAFPLTEDPRKKKKSWSKAVASEEAQEFRTQELQLAMGSGSVHDILGGSGVPVDHFGILARGGLQLPRGKWRLKVRSDDGMRLYVDGELKLEDWTHHATKEHVFEIRLPQPTTLPIRIEYFELDGAAHLSLDVEKVKTN